MTESSQQLSANSEQLTVNRWLHLKLTWMPVFGHEWLLTVICWLLAVLCNGQSITGAWVGVKEELDSGFVCSLPLYLDARADSTYTLSLIDKAATNPKATWAMNGKWLRLDTLLFQPKQVQLTANTLTLTGHYPMQFRRVPTPNTALTEAATRTLLANRSWQLDQTRYHFHEGGQACLETNGGRDRAVRCWTVVERGGAVFLVIKGTETDCSRSYDVPMLCRTSTDKQLMVSLLTDETKLSTLVMVAALPAGKTCAAIGFHRCSNCFSVPDNQASELDKHGPPGRFYAVRQQLLRLVRPSSVARPTGILQVRCLVNCAGQAGQFSVNACNSDYEPAVFDKSLTDQVMSMMQTHFSAGWQPGRIRGIDRPLDYVATINIRFLDGLITDVFP